MNTQELKQFLLDSNKAGYAGGEAKKWVKEKDGSTTIPYEQGEWKSHDNFFGGEPYGGRLVVFFQNKPVWMMVYYGWVKEGVKPDNVYGILTKALNKMPESAPFRGPEKLINGYFVYANSWTGDVERYSGEEKITFKGELVYKANYFGGLVDQK